jgi:hypothetical protein
MLPKLKPVSLETLSDIRCSCFIGMHPSRDFDKKILVIRFEGTYRFGSAGASDASFIGAMGRAAAYAFRPHGVITDFSALKYQWGDEMAGIVDGFSDDDPIPSALVVGEGCRVALGTLFFNFGGPSPASVPAPDPCDRESVFDTREMAWQYVTEQIDSGFFARPL